MLSIGLSTPLWRVFIIICLVCGSFRTFMVNAQQDATLFSCDGRTAGYYADVSSGCQVYHMCDGLGRQFSYKCPRKTLFQQRMLICDHWYMVNCSKAEEDYSANLLIGQQGRPFVEDLQFHRTPRPDLVEPSHSNYNTYRVDQGETFSGRNVVGADDSDAKATTDEPKYFPPSHWSTDVASEATTPTPYKRQESGTRVSGLSSQVYYQTNYASRRNGEVDGENRPRSKALNFDSFNRNGNSFIAHTTPKIVSYKENLDKSQKILRPQTFPVEQRNDRIEIGLSKQENAAPVVNFPSNFKATTPVYPKRVDVDLSKFTDFDGTVDQGAEDAQEEEVNVNFPSNFKATTPVYPEHVNVDPYRLSEFDIQDEAYARPQDNLVINFESKFRATTPVYPKQVDVDLTKFSVFEDQPPEQPKQEERPTVNFASNFKATTPVYPKAVNLDLSKFLEPVELPIQENPINVAINFASNFQATTPVYPLSVEATSPNPNEAGLVPPVDLEKSNVTIQQGDVNSLNVNFQSNFQATTPNYPKSVEPTSPDPNEAGLVAPISNNQQLGLPNFGLELIPPKPFSQIFTRRADEDDPSVLGNTFNSQQLTEFMLTMKPEQLKNLRDMWKIPEYDFPLDTVPRPSYNSDFSSFQVKSSSKR